MKNKIFLKKTFRNIKEYFDFSSIVIGNSTRSTSRYQANKDLFEVFKQKYPDFIKMQGELIYLYQNLDKPKSYISQRLCPVCGNLNPWVGFYRESCYQPHCSAKCGHVNPEVNKKRTRAIRKTCLKKYGTTSTLDAPGMREKTMAGLKKSREKNPAFHKLVRILGMNSEEAVETRKKVCRKKFQADSPFESKKFQKQLQKECFEKHGMRSRAGLTSTKENIKKSYIKKFGVDNPFKSEEIKERIRERHMLKRGVSHHMKTEEYQERVRLKNKEYRNSHEYKKLMDDRMIERRRKRFYKEKVSARKYNDILPKFTIEEYLTPKKKFRFRCLGCDHVFKAKVTNSFQHVTCPKCYRSKKESKGERTVKLWLESLGFNPKKERNLLKEVRSGRVIPYEIDMYIKEKKIGIEYHGVYWHRAKDSSVDYKHKKKFLLAKEAGIHLIQIFEYEWSDARKRKILKSFIRRYLGLTVSTKVAYARKCKVINIENERYKAFLEKHHLQGYVPAKARLGLEYEGKLIAVASFGPSRFKSGETELIRLCFRRGWNIIGGLSRLVKTYVREHKPEKLISYIDARFFTGNGYLSAGFRQIGHTKPNYFYAVDGKLKSRIAFQKHKLEDKLEHFDPELSEYENMLMNRYYRLFDAGNLKMEYENSKY